MSLMFVQGSHTFAMFYVHAHMRYVKNGEYPSHITLTTFTRFAQNSTVVSACIVLLHHAYTYTKKAINLAPLLEDIRTTFFSA